MSEIADEGGVSKALLFHYFINKKELYMYLWENAIEMTRKTIIEYKTLETSDFFEMLKRSLLSKCSVLRKDIDLWKKIYRKRGLTNSA